MTKIPKDALERLIKTIDRYQSKHTSEVNEDDRVALGVARKALRGEEPPEVKPKKKSMFDMNEYNQVLAEFPTDGSCIDIDFIIGKTGISRIKIVQILWNLDRSGKIELTMSAVKKKN